MKTLLTVGLAFMGSTAVAAPAQAHYLSEHRAELRAEGEASSFADEDEYYAWSCPKRFSGHVRRCSIASYDEEGDTTCDAYVRVRFAGWSSRRTVAGRWYAIDCGDGNPYELGETY